MKKSSKFSRILAIVFCLCSLAITLINQGCQRRGLSGPGKTTTLGYDLTKLKSKKIRQKPLKLPFHLVVAQAGALQPDSRLLNELKRFKKLYRVISFLPAAPELRNFGKEVAQRDPEELIKLAEGLGGDLLFLVGGKIETQSARTPISVLDLTVIGHYLIPSNKIKTKGSVMAAVIDIADRKLIMTVEEGIEKSKISPSVSRHSNTDELNDKTIGRLLQSIAIKFSNRLAHNAGIKTEPSHFSKIEKVKIRQYANTATVYVISDGFHIGLILPHGEKDGIKQYIEVGLGERNWAMDQKWQWLNGIMSGISHNEGVAVVETMDDVEFIFKKEKQKRVWKLDLSEWQWGEMLTTLERDVALQEVLYEGGKTKIVKTINGYNLFYTCQQFALNPLGVVDKNLFNHISKPTPMVENHLDNIFLKSTVMK